MKQYRYFFILCIVLGMTCIAYGQEVSEPIFHKSHRADRNNAPFSEVVQAGNLFFLAGQIGMDRDKKLLPETIEEQTKQAIKNIEGVLKHHGLTLDNVVKCTVILSDINDFKAFNGVYTQYFTKKPARTTFAAKDLAIGAKIEIDVIAVK